MGLLGTGFQITIIGMGIVFLVLFLLSLVLRLFESLIYKEHKTIKSSRSERENKKQVIGKESEEDEIAAVISVVMTDLLEGKEYITNIKEVF